MSPPNCCREWRQSTPPPAEILDLIYHDEIEHVTIGTTWHRHWCAQQGIEPSEHFCQVSSKYFSDQIPSPFELTGLAEPRQGFGRGTRPPRRDRDRKLRVRVPPLSLTLTCNGARQQLHSSLPIQSDVLFIHAA